MAEQQCEMCGRLIDAHNRHVRFRLPEPVLTSPDQEKVPGAWLSHDSPEMSVMMQIPSVGAGSQRNRLGQSGNCPLRRGHSGRHAGETGCREMGVGAGRRGLILLASTDHGYLRVLTAPGWPGS